MTQLSRFTPTVTEILARFSEVSAVSQSNTRVVSVLIPVFGQPELVMKCIMSYVESIPFNSVQSRLIVVDDRGPDPQLREDLRRLSAKGLLVLVENEKNFGFPKSCNRGFDEYPDDDVIVLNSDTVLPLRWLDRIVAVADKNPEIASVTPLSNDATICSYPVTLQKNQDTFFDVNEIADAAHAVNGLACVEAPSGVGFCMFMRRSALKVIGGFDAETFNKGYGEENDWCQRAIKAGFRNVIAAGAYVHHVGGGSFGAEKAQRVAIAQERLGRLHPNYASDVDAFIRADPLDSYRQKIDFELIKSRFTNGVDLIITHNGGGGTQRAVAEAARESLRLGRGTLVGRADPRDSRNRSISIEHFHSTFGSNIGAVDVALDQDFLSRLRDSAGLTRVNLHHLLGFAPDFSDSLLNSLKLSGVELQVTLHDYYPLCPRVSLVSVNGVYCGVPDVNHCQKCLDSLGDVYGNHQNIAPWLERWSRLLEYASTVTVPSRAAADIILRRFPTLRIAVVPHMSPGTRVGLELTPTVKNSKQKKESPKVIVVLGAISRAKGSRQLLECVRLAETKLPHLRFVLIGYTEHEVESQLRKFRNVRITGAYDDNDLVTLISRENPDLVWYPAIWPETFCYTLNAALEIPNVPIVSFDIGAIADRVRAAGRGWVIPLGLALSPDETLSKLIGYANFNSNRRS